MTFSTKFLDNQPHTVDTLKRENSDDAEVVLPIFWKMQHF